jgi:hypothetical protein
MLMAQGREMLNFQCSMVNVQVDGRFMSETEIEN